VEEAKLFLSGANPTATFKWVSDAATFHSLTLEQAARFIMFKNEQSENILLESEAQRQVFTRRILTDPTFTEEMLKVELYL
jgi:hypothetical protein